MVDYNLLIAKAQDSLQRSYSPYSGFKVGAALLTADGQIFGGTNIENGSFGATICAERVAMFSAITAGCLNFCALAVVAELENPCFPCGICRQVFTEFAPQMDIVLLQDGKTIVHSATDLLPFAFNLKQEKK